MTKEYIIHLINSSRIGEEEHPFHYYTTDFETDLGKEFLERYVKTNHDLLKKHKKISEIEIKIICKK